MGNFLKYISRHILLLFSICLCVSISYAKAKRRLAILEFTGSSGLSTDQLMYLSDQMRAEAQHLIGDQFVIMTREIMSELTDSPELIEACEKNCEVDIGRALQAHWVISGQVFGGEQLYRATLKLHDVVRGISIEIEFAEGEQVADLTTELKEANGRLVTHLMNAHGDEQLAGIQLPSAVLPQAFKLSASDTLGLPIPLLKQYDQALLIDEDQKANIEAKLEVWSKLSRYANYPKLQSEALRRLRYWRQRFKRRVQCNNTWQQLEQLLSLKRALSKSKKESLIESFLDACGRDQSENPHLNAPYFVNKRREQKLKEAKAEAKRLRLERTQLVKAAKAKSAREKKKAQEVEALKAAQLRNEEEYSVLETHIGASYHLKVGSISSYHLRLRLQPQSWWSRQVFLDAETSFTQVDSLTEANATWSGEWAGAMGVQWLNQSDWIPSLSLGYQIRGEEQRLLSELALRYRPIKEWLNIHIGVQYFHLVSDSSSSSVTKGSLPRLNLLDQSNDELRLSIWLSTGVMGLSLILMSIFILSQQ